MFGLRLVLDTLPPRPRVAAGDEAAPTDARFTLDCPTCHLRYRTERDGEPEPWDGEALEWEALTRLAEECPDHPHRFAVGP